MIHFSRGLDDSLPVIFDSLESDFIARLSGL
jgi:hypothetical protein